MYSPVHFVQLGVESHEVEVRIERNLEGSDDVIMVIVCKESMEAEILYASFFFFTLLPLRHNVNKTAKKCYVSAPAILRQDSKLYNANQYTSFHCKDPFILFI